jgi:hypothetical protein
MNLMLSIILVSFPYSIKILLVYDVYFFIIPFTRFSARFLLKLVAKQIKHIYIYDVCMFSSLPCVDLDADKMTF